MCAFGQFCTVRLVFGHFSGGSFTDFLRQCVLSDISLQFVLFSDTFVRFRPLPSNFGRYCPISNLVRFRRFSSHGVRSPSGVWKKFFLISGLWRIQFRMIMVQLFLGQSWHQLIFSIFLLSFINYNDRKRNKEKNSTSIKFRLNENCFCIYGHLGIFFCSRNLILVVSSWLPVSRWLFWMPPSAGGYLCPWFRPQGLFVSDATWWNSPCTATSQTLLSLQFWVSSFL